MKAHTSIITKTLIGSFLLLVGLCIATPVSAEEISHFSADIKINQDASVSITEEIQYDFEEAERHGIFRDIPVSYETDAGNRRIFLEVTSVSQDGDPAQFEMSWEGDSRRIRIGDPDVTISGEHTYEITYKVRGALNYFDEFDELYWNVTGNEWEVPINQAEATVSLPGSVSPANIQSACYSGQSGSDQECGNQSISTSSVTASTENLQSREGLTVAVGFPKNLVTEPESVQKLWRWLSANLIILLPIATFFVMLFLWYVWGRDPEGRGAIMAQYEPPEGMRPTMVGSLIDEKVHDKDISAGIIYLAEQGFIKIRRLEGKKLLIFDSVDYELILEKPVSEVPTQTEKDVAKILFGSETEAGESVRISDIKDDTSVALKIKELKMDVQERLAEEGYFVKNPDKVVGWYWLASFLLIFVTLFFGVANGTLTSLVAVGVSAVIINVFGHLMPRKTKQGALVKEHLKGFKHFLSMTQKERLEFHNAPERTTSEFMQYLPYAVALGIETDWADQFKDVYIETPGWYEGNVSGRVAATAFASDLSEATSGISKGVSSAAASGGSGSSGGGFSGGGMGGGGGGSW